ncbi:MAG: alternative ribosome rescue aminoacyl-tRNA hydrolase ArfB [Cytophagales bacterium]
MSKGKKPRVSHLLSEIKFSSARSSGPGGQHANKVESRVILSLNISKSRILNENDKKQIRDYLKNRINKEGILSNDCEKTRSQQRNKEIALDKLQKLLLKVFRNKKKRISTKTPKSAVEKRIREKKKRSEKKNYRQKPGEN